MKRSRVTIGRTKRRQVAYHSVAAATSLFLTRATVSMRLSCQIEKMPCDRIWAAHATCRRSCCQLPKFRFVANDLLNCERENMTLFKPLQGLFSLSPSVIKQIISVSVSEIAFLRTLLLYTFDSTF